MLTGHGSHGGFGIPLLTRENLQNATPSRDFRKIDKIKYSVSPRPGLQTDLLYQIILGGGIGLFFEQCRVARYVLSGTLPKNPCLGITCMDWPRELTSLIFSVIYRSKDLMLRRTAVSQHSYVLQQDISACQRSVGDPCCGIAKGRIGLLLLRGV
jgi:hypothetical protein